jgi:lysophospholipase L1-like esterase
MKKESVKEGGDPMSDFARFQARLREKAENVRARAVTYVAFGDSVTQGAMENGVLEYERVYHQVLRRHAEQRYPGTVCNVINSGVGGDTAHDSRSRWERDVLMYRPDLVTICFGHNDAHGREEGLDRFLKALGDLIDRIRTETEAEVLLMTPCMMMTRDNERVAEEHKPLVPAFVKLAEDGILPMYADAVRRLAAERNVPLLDVYAMWERMIQAGQDHNVRLANGINHPDREFHVEWGQALADRLLAD